MLDAAQPMMTVLFGRECDDQKFGSFKRSAYPESDDQRLIQAVRVVAIPYMHRYASPDMRRS